MAKKYDGIDWRKTENAKFEEYDEILRREIRAGRWPMEASTALQLDRESLREAQGAVKPEVKVLGEAAMERFITEMSGVEMEDREEEEEVEVEIEEEDVEEKSVETIYDRVGDDERLDLTLGSVMVGGDESDDDDEDDLPARWSEVKEIKPDASGKGLAPWDRAKGEPHAEYQAFMVYLYAPYPRSMKVAYAAWKKLIKNEKLGYKPPASMPKQWEAWNRLWNWDGRADEYDKATTDRISDVVGSIRARAEWELQDALMTGLRRVVDRVREERSADFKELSLSSALYAIPNLTREIRNQLGLNQDEKITLDRILDVLPQQLRQQLLIAINIENVNLPAGEKPATGMFGEVIEGEVKELKSGEGQD